MTIRVFITIDTEEDTWDTYSAAKNPVNNIKRLPNLQAMMEKYEALPTYLINYPVAKDPYAISFFDNLLTKDKCEVGAHCHPWNTPPYEESISKQNSFMCNLPYELQYKKLYELTSVIQNNIGYRPLCFRAGRWGFGPDTAKAISNLGYKTDTTITPMMDWQQQHMGPDFSDVGLGIYWLNSDNMLFGNLKEKLLEVTPTIGFLQNNFKRCQIIRTFIRESPLSKLHIARILDELRLLNFRWLSPELSTAPELIRLSKSFIKEGYEYLNMTFHSTSLLPGKSLFVRTENDLDNFLKRIETFLKFVTDQGFIFSKLSDAKIC